MDRSVRLVKYTRDARKISMAVCESVVAVLLKLNRRYNCGQGIYIEREREIIVDRAASYECCKGDYNGSFFCRSLLRVYNIAVIVCIGVKLKGADRLLFTVCIYIVVIHDS